MKIIKPYYEIMTEINREKILKNIEIVGRTCYKSEDKITDNSAGKFVKMLINRSHEAILEHESITVRFICDRGFSHEAGRHRLTSLAQSSTRYCNYSQDKFGNEITVIKPCFFEEGTEKYDSWHCAVSVAEVAYMNLLKSGAKPEEARSVLPNSLMTELVMTANLREWRHIFKLRTAKAAHPQMRELTIPLLNDLKERLPEIFGDIEVEI